MPKFGCPADSEWMQCVYMCTGIEQGMGVNMNDLERKKEARPRPRAMIPCAGDAERQQVQCWIGGFRGQGDSGGVAQPLKTEKAQSGL